MDLRATGLDQGHIVLREVEIKSVLRVVRLFFRFLLAWAEPETTDVVL